MRECVKPLYFILNVFLISISLLLGNIIKEKDLAPDSSNEMTETFLQTL